ncbi:MAG TPA: hypothetical protein VEJ89_09040 [Myxococcaceae bacterium]|nr:hypothetical protein [Myxococcaceae bacterium]
MGRNLHRVLFAGLLAMALTGCGSSLEISPSSASLNPGQTQVFTASGGSGGGYQWAMVRNLSGGIIDAGGKYTAGPNASASEADVIGVRDSSGDEAQATVTVVPALDWNFMCGATGGGPLPLLVFAVLPGVLWRVGRRVRRVS